MGSRGAAGDAQSVDAFIGEGPEPVARGDEAFGQADPVRGERDVADEVELALEVEDEEPLVRGGQEAFGPQGVGTEEYLAAAQLNGADCAFACVGVQLDLVSTTAG